MANACRGHHAVCCGSPAPGGGPDPQLMLCCVFTLPKTGGVAGRFRFTLASPSPMGTQCSPLEIAPFQKESTRLAVGSGM